MAADIMAVTDRPGSRILLPLLLTSLSAIALPAYALREVATSSDLVRLWKAGWGEADLLEFIAENTLWVELSVADVADMAEAGMPRETIDKIVAAIERNQPAPAAEPAASRPRRSSGTLGNPGHLPRHPPRRPVPADVVHRGDGHSGGGHRGGGHHGGRGRH